MRQVRPVPPRVPEACAELDEATMLLGSLVKGPLKESRRQRVASLLGQLPRSPDEAAAWKSALKALRRELAELGES